MLIKLFQEHECEDYLTISNRVAKEIEITATQPIEAKAPLGMQQNKG